MTKLEKATYVCLMAVLLVALGLMLENRFFPRTPPGVPKESELVGRQEASVPETYWKGSAMNVVLLLSTHCHYCAESTPLYQQLTAMRQQTSQGMSLLVATTDPTDQMHDYLTRNRITVDKILETDAGFAGVSLTPAIFLVDSHGVIRKAFIGKLGSSSEARLMTSIKN
jgi:hypothetical protein